MLATFFSLLLILTVYLNTEALAALAAFPHSSLLLSGTATFFLLILALFWISATSALQRAEKRIVPRVFDLFLSDWTLRLMLLALAAFTMLSYVLAIPHLAHAALGGGRLLLIWFILLAFAIEILHGVYRRILHYVNPTTALELLEKRALQAAAGGDIVETTEWMDSLYTLAIKAQRQADMRLSEEAVQRMFSILDRIVAGRLENRLSHEELSFPFVYYSQRMELLFLEGLREHNETLCQRAATQLGKGAALGAFITPELFSIPFVFLQKAYRRATRSDLVEFPEQASVMLVEVAREIVENAKEHGTSFKDALLTIIAQLEEMEEAKYRAQKDIDIDILKQPFRELFAILKDDRILQHPDTVPVLETIERVVGDFSNLELIMRRMLSPELPEEEADEAAPEQEETNTQESDEDAS